MPCIGIKTYDVIARDKITGDKEHFYVRGTSVTEVLRTLREEGYSVYPNDVKYQTQTYIGQKHKRVKALYRKDLEEIVNKIVDVNGNENATKDILRDWGLL